MPEITDQINELLRELDRLSPDSARDRPRIFEIVGELEQLDEQHGLPAEVRDIVDHARQTAVAHSRAVRTSSAVTVDEFESRLAPLGYSPDQVQEHFTTDPHTGQATPRRGDTARLPGPGDRPGEQRPTPGQPAPTGPGTSVSSDDIRALAEALGVSVEELSERLLGDEAGEADPDPFIGVPQDHAFIPDPTASPDRIMDSPRLFGPRKPRYRQSDIEEPFGWGQARIAQLQDRLVAAGMLTGAFRRGWYDEATGQAYARALGFANQRGDTVVRALDQLTQQRATQRQEERTRAVAAFQPQVDLPPDPAALRQRARETLIQSGRRPWQIDESEIAQMVDVLSGEFRRAREVEIERQRRMHEAQVSADFAMPGEQPAPADLSDLDGVDPLARFDEWFEGQYGDEVEARQQRGEAQPTIAGFGQVLLSGADQVRRGH